MEHSKNLLDPVTNFGKVTVSTGHDSLQVLTATSSTTATGRLHQLQKPFLLPFSRMKYATLFSVIMTVYGAGNGSTTNFIIKT